MTKAKEHVGLRLSPKMLEELKQEAQEKDMTLSEYIRLILELRNTM